uniref:Uncharacterized protein n=1 Tax=Rhizophora mucronata TaxID=61149 RepID=A0A2P2R1U6_RHIMU
MDTPNHLALSLYLKIVIILRERTRFSNCTKELRKFHLK